MLTIGTVILILWFQIKLAGDKLWLIDSWFILWRLFIREFKTWCPTIYKSCTTNIIYSFIHCLKLYIAYSSGIICELEGDVYERKRPWPISVCYTSISLEGVMETKVLVTRAEIGIRDLSNMKAGYALRNWKMNTMFWSRYFKEETTWETNVGWQVNSKEDYIEIGLDDYTELAEGMT